MSEAMKHVEVLAGDIGPRPATTDAEKRAANYIQALFAARGLEAEVQDFDSPRTYAWAYVLYHFVTIAAAVLAGVWDRLLVWPAFGLAALNAFLLAMDLDTRWGLTSIMPKGPSQNVIARHVPHARRGERLRKVVVVAHYDSARASLAFSPRLVRRFGLLFGLMKACTFAVPIMILAMALPFTSPAEPWLWYATMAVSAYLLVPFFVNAHRELFMRFTDGANDNAAGVGAMLAVMEAIVPSAEVSGYLAESFPSVRRGPEAAEEADVIPEGAALSYDSADSSDETALPDGFTWAASTGRLPNEHVRGQASFEFDTVEFESVPSAGRVRERTVGAGGGDDLFGDDEAEADLGSSESPEATAVESRTGLLERFGRSQGGKSSGGKHRSPRGRRSNEDVTGWLGVDSDFDARKTGEKIGSWDNFDEDADDRGGSGRKGGWAGEDPIADEDFAAEEAARIRRRVTETVDRKLSEKEVWFVSTGAEEVGTHGMKAFLDKYGEEVKDAFIINMDHVGSGALYWITAEGMLRLYSADRRLTGLAKRVSREHEILVKPRVYRGLSTDATPALARGYKAMSIMGFDNEGCIPHWHWYTDTDDHVDAAVVDRASDFVINMIRDA